MFSSKFLRPLVLVIACTALTSISRAVTISLSPSTASLISGDDTSQGAINTKIAPWVGSFDVLYKAVPNSLVSEEGAFKDSYLTTYGIPLPKASATITYDGAPDSYIHTSPLYLLIKGGNVNAPLKEWYLFDISTWDGISNIELSGFYGGNQGKISHISIYGGASSVPDGSATLMLLGVTLAGLSWIARRRTA